MASEWDWLSPFPSHDYPAYETPSQKYENASITYFEIITGLPRPYHITNPPWWAAYNMQKYGKFGEIPIPLTRTWVEDAAPQNSLPHLLWTATLCSLEKCEEKQLNSKAGAIIRETTAQTPPRTASVRGGARRRKAIEGKRRRYGKGNQRQKPPADRQRGEGGRDRNKTTTNTKWKGDTTYSPAMGGKCQAENA